MKFENVCQIDKFSNEDNDQLKLTMCYNKCNDCITLDYDNILFYCVETNGVFTEYINLILKKQPHMEKDTKFYSIEDNRLVLKKNNSKPVFVQGNGNINMDILAKQLNLPLQITDNRNYFEYSTKTLIFTVLKLLMGYFIFALHILTGLFVLAIPFITNNVYILFAIIVLYIFIVIQWNISVGCVLDKYGLSLKNSSACKEVKAKSIYISFLENYFGEKTQKS